MEAVKILLICLLSFLSAMPSRQILPRHRFPKPLQLISIQLLDVVSRHVVNVKIVSSALGPLGESRKHRKPYVFQITGHDWTLKGTTNSD